MIGIDKWGNKTLNYCLIVDLPMPLASQRGGGESGRVVDDVMSGGDRGDNEASQSGVCLVCIPSMTTKYD